MKTIIWQSKEMKSTKELTKYLDELIQKYDIITVTPTKYIGGFGTWFIDSAIIIVKDK